MAGKQLKSMERGALLALLVALSEPDGIGNGRIANGSVKKKRKGERAKAGAAKLGAKAQRKKPASRSKPKAP